jgi:KaiC/GvpD/RAD55 family RecA-like ATPase
MIINEFLSTGIEKLDKLLEGGTPKGYVVLVLGTPGSSIEILSKQLATKGRVLYFTTEETQSEIIDTMRRFGWEKSNIDFIDIASEYSKIIIDGEQKRVSIYEQRSKSRLRELIEIGSQGILETSKEEKDFLAVLSNNIKNSNSDKIIVDSLDFFMNQYTEEEVIKTIHAAKICNLEKKGVLFLFMTRGIHGDIFERKMEGIADCILELEVLQKGSSFERFLAVKKMKNYAKKIGIARYAIDSDGFVLEMIERIM